MTGTVFYKGPSQLGGKPIVAIATAGSSNRKTGDMLQTWILRDRIDPVRAIANGGDASICGDCVHRGTDGVRTCYVNVGQAPLSIWRAYKRNRYERQPLAAFLAEHGGKPLRMGAYGDPVAVPIDAWRGVESLARWTGYTHQWRNPIAAPFRSLLMASCDSVADAADAAAAGWRSFLVRPVGNLEPRPGAIECPSNRGVQCAACSLCSGTSKPKAPSIWIEAHGTARRFVGTSKGAV